MDACEIRLLRTSLGLTEAELAYRLNVTTRTVQRWEAGQRRPDETACREMRALVAACLAGH